MGNITIFSGFVYYSFQNATGRYILFICLVLFDVIYQNRNLMKRQTTVNASVITKFFARSHKTINYIGFSHQLYHQTLELHWK